MYKQLTQSLWYVASVLRCGISKQLCFGAIAVSSSCVSEHDEDDFGLSWGVY